MLAHPFKKSFNFAVADICRSILTKTGNTVYFHDLYREKFNPVLHSIEIRRSFSFDTQVQTYTEHLNVSDILIFIHPDWWSQPPAILKGWIERVFRPGVAYEFRGDDFVKKTKTALLTGKKALVFCTTDSAADEDIGLLRTIWEKAVFSYCGIDKISFSMFYNVRNRTFKERKEWLDSIEQKVLQALHD